MTFFNINHVMPLAVTVVVLAQGVLVMLVSLSRLASNQNYLILGVDP